MLKRTSLISCPSCGRHVLRGAASCPHCESRIAPLRRVSPSVIAVMMGLGAVTATSAACQKEEPADDDGSGGDGDGGDWFPDDGDGNAGSGYPSAVSTYGVGPSGPVSSSSTGADPTCASFPNETDCDVCLNSFCCDERLICADSFDCMSFASCLSECGPDDIVCAAACQESNPTGYTLFQELFQCAQPECGACEVP